jgi:EmrB/QacA subfamily drug resistance transporter
MISIEATIVSTAMPKIVTYIGKDLRLYSWVFSVFLLAQATTTMVFGKLADTFGRKPILLIGITLFLLSSLLCGLAWSMTSLIIFRLLQGLAAGSIQPVTQTLAGDMYPGLERGRVQGYIGVAYGTSSILGPLVGAVIVQHLRWGWIFWINIPFGALAALGFYLFVKERIETKRPSVDVVGSGLFMIAVASLMLTLNSVTGGHPARLFAFGTLLLVSTALFVLQERTTREPMLPFGVLSRRPLAKLNGLALLCGALLIGILIFLPIYVQAVLGRSPVTVGLTLTAQVLGWTISALLAMQAFRRFGLDKTLVMGTAFFPLSAAALLAMVPASQPLLAGLAAFMNGLGMGIVTTASIAIVQDSVGWAERGLATSLNIFLRNLGSALGAATLGTVVNIHLDRSGSAAGIAGVRALLQGPSGMTIASGARNALHGALHLAFWVMLLLGALVVVLAMLGHARSTSEALERRESNKLRKSQN